MTTSSPRLDPRLLHAISELDDHRAPLAETWRRVGVLAEQIGVPRPCYDTVRGLAVTHRRHREELRRLLEPVASDLLRGRFSRWDVNRLIEAAVAVRENRAESEH